jgi:uridine kinase
MEPYLIGIAGPSCSGKSEVSRRLARILRAPVLPLDAYYRELDHLPFEERVRTNFDAPDALDRELVAEHVQTLKAGGAVDRPVYDFARHTRSGNVERIPSAEFVVIEGLFALYWPEVRALLDKRVYISAEHETCLARRIFRDVRERGRTEESVREQYARTVLPMCDEYVAPTIAFAEVVLRGVDSVKHSVHTLLTHIAEEVKDERHLPLYLEAPDAV